MISTVPKTGNNKKRERNFSDSEENAMPKKIRVRPEKLPKSLKFCLKKEEVT